MYFTFSALTLLVGRQEGQLACKKTGWSFAWLIAPVVTTASIINLLQWTPGNPGSPGKWPLKRRERERVSERERVCSSMHVNYCRNSSVLKVYKIFHNLHVYNNNLDSESNVAPNFTNRTRLSWRHKLYASPPIPQISFPFPFHPSLQRKSSHSHSIPTGTEVNRHLTGLHAIIKHGI